jgi:hypothetical protein
LKEIFGVFAAPGSAGEKGENSLAVGVEGLLPVVLPPIGPGFSGITARSSWFRQWISLALEEVLSRDKRGFRMLRSTSGVWV